MSKKGKIRDRRNLPPAAKSIVDSMEKEVPQGLYNQAMHEMFPMYEKAGCEIVESNNHNAHILVGS